MSAINDVGESSQSAEVSFLASDLPDAPSKPTLVSSTTTSVTFEWEPPSDNGGSTIEKYEIYHKESTEDESSWALLANTDINTLQYTHSSISATDDVQYKIRAVSDRGEGEFSVRNTFVLASVPTISAAPTLNEQTKTSITVSWALTSNGGAAVTGYYLYQTNVTTGGQSIIYDGSSIPTVTSAKIEGLTTGDEYTYSVVAINRVGNSNPSAESNTFKAAEVPGAPEAPEYLSSTSTTITLLLSSVDDNGGSTITEYKLYVDDGTLTGDFTEVASYDGSSLSPTIDNTVETALVSGGLYRFKLSAVNEIGEGELSNEIRIGLGGLPD